MTKLFSLKRQVYFNIICMCMQTNLLVTLHINGSQKASNVFYCIPHRIHSLTCKNIFDWNTYWSAFWHTKSLIMINFNHEILIYRVKEMTASQNG